VEKKIVEQEDRGNDPLLQIRRFSPDLKIKSNKFQICGLHCICKRLFHGIKGSDPKKLRKN